MMSRTNPPDPSVALCGVPIVLRLWGNVRHCGQEGGLLVTMMPWPFEARAPRSRDRKSSFGVGVEEQRMRLQGSRVPGTEDVGLGHSHWPGEGTEICRWPWDTARMHNTDRICKTHAVRLRSGLRP